VNGTDRPKGGTFVRTGSPARVYPHLKQHELAKKAIFIREN
jgi:hypothetical protein